MVQKYLESKCANFAECYYGKKKSSRPSSMITCCVTTILQIHWPMQKLTMLFLPLPNITELVILYFRTLTLFFALFQLDFF